MDEDGAPAPVTPVQPERGSAAATSSPADRAREAVRPEDEARQPVHLSSWLLRVGLAFVFVYAATISSIDPVAAATYFPSVLPREWVMEVVLPAFVVYEVLLAVGLLTARYTYAASLLAAATMVGIIVVNANAFDVLFRNVAIAFAALSLAVQTREARGAEAPDHM